MKLNTVLENIPVIETAGDTETEITSVIYDSRKAAPGCLFAAVKGEKADGHRFIPAALEKGAAAVLHEDYTGAHEGVTLVRVADSRRAMALAAANFYGRPSERLSLVGITGTNGKTTTSYLIKAALEHAGMKTGLLGTITYLIGDEKLPAPNTTPESVDLQGLLARMADGGADAAVIEVSSHAVSLDRIAGCGFAVKAFSNFTQDHLDFHCDMESYYAAKKRLFTDYGGANVINADDPKGADLAASASGKVLTYGVEIPADVTARGLTLTADGIRFTLVTPAGEAALSSRMVGRHNAYNLLCAAGVCFALGMSPVEIADGLAAMTEVPGRLEKVDAGQSFTVLVDYAHTEDALVRVMAAAREITRGRLITVFGCGGDRDKTKRPKMGYAAAAHSDLVILTSDNPRTEDPDEIIRQAEAGIAREGSKTKGAGYLVLPDRAEAIEKAVGMAAAGDTVLIAGKGHEDYQIIGETKYHFDDRETARKAMQGLGVRD